ncbi:type II toxin-antitoxin system RelE/ParE family toxin [Patescibacteria group bacterium]
MIEFFYGNIIFNQSIERFIESFEKSIIAKILRTVDLLEKFEHQLGMPHSKKINKDLFELRIRGKREIRIIYSFYQNKIILLNAFIKKESKNSTKGHYFSAK